LNNKASEKDILIAEIVGVHGIRGNLRVCSYAESDDIFTPGMSVRLKNARKEEFLCTVKQVSPYRQGLLFCLEGVDDRNRAESMVGYGIYIEKSLLPTPEDGSYYWSDLIGLSVFGKGDVFLGKVESLIPTGSNDVYVVKNGKKEILIPAIATVVTEIDPEGGIIRVDLPEGL